MTMPAAAALLALCSAASPYAFNGPIPQAVLERYLARSLQTLGLCSEGSSGPAPGFDDSLRMVRRTGAKFLGRAAYAWDCPADDERHFRIAHENAARVHAQDPEAILQACVFETAYSSKSPEALERARKGSPQAGVEDVPIPAWVFREFGDEPEVRNFRYEEMLYPDGRMRNLWMPGGSVPDITRRETQYWFLYRARRYIDAGYEAIHFGQVQLVGQRDEGWRCWAAVVARTRRYAALHARRKWVLCDGHFVMNRPDPGVIFNGTFLWDFLGFPLRPVETAEPLGAELRADYLDTMYGRAPGGIHPAGWRCAEIPQLYEVDNCMTGLSDAGGVFLWGADEATWLANLPDERRRAFLDYAYRWVRDHTRSGHFQMPGRRPATVPVTAPKLWFYNANDRSQAFPDGLGDEAAIRSAWDRAADNPRKPVPAPAATAPAPLPRKRPVAWFAAVYRAYGIMQSDEERRRGREELAKLGGL
jgi:hypothetical protein